MPTVDINLIVRQSLEKLLAAPRANRYPNPLAIGQNADFPILQEIKDNALIIDQALCTDIISAPAGHPYATNFMTPSKPLSNGDRVPPHIGSDGDVVVALTDTNKVYKPSEVAKSRGEILRMIDNETFYGGPSRFHFIEGGFLYHSGFQDSPSAKVYYPVFTKSSICQCPEAYTDVLLFGTVSLCEKIDMTDAFFQKYNGLYLAGRQMIKQGAEYIPPQEQLEQAIDARRAA